jgi:ABC-type multidrug transport system fused ATPase/permease subunit
MDNEKKNKKNLSFFSNASFMFKEHWGFDRLFLLLPIVKIPLSVGASLIGVIMPKIVLDALMRSGHQIGSMIFQIALCTIILAVFKTLSAKTEAVYKIRNNQFFVLHGFVSLFEKKMDMDYELFSSPKGKVAAKKAEMASQGNIYMGISSFFRSLTEALTNFFGFSAFTAILVSLNPMIILFLLLSYGVDGIIALLVEKANHKDREKWSEVYRKRSYISSRISLTAYAKDIRIYSLTGWLKAVYQSIVTEELDLTSRRAKRQMLQMLLEGFLVFVRDGFAYWYLIHIYLTTGMEIGNFTVYFAAISGFGSWLADMVSDIYSLQNANHSVSDYRTFIETKDSTRVKNGIKLKKDGASLSVQLSHVSYTYPESDRAVLDDISLDIKAGENLALVGVNGAGKTTLAMLICGLIRPTKGEIYINNINIREIDREDYFNLIAAVFQDASVMPIAIDENITFGLPKNSLTLRNVLDLAGLYEKIAELPKGLKTRLMTQFNEDSIELSGGEIQKLLLARALYKDAPILILDEPTAALDPIAENELYQKYHKLTSGKTSVYISHRLSSTQFCDRIVLLDGTKIAEIGTHSELMEKDGKYAEMFRLSSRYYREDGAEIYV